jgi:hypothetical protein
MKIGKIYDWHSPHNNLCPQNTGDLDKDCTCQQRVKKNRKCDVINRKCCRERLLAMANSFQSVRIFTQVKPSTLNDIAGMVEAELRRRAQNSPRTGKTL